MDRVAVVGCPGAGKTTVAARLAQRLDLTHIELDAVFHRPGWTQCPADEFVAELGARMERAGGRWVTSGNYVDTSGGLHLYRASVIVWLDLPRGLATRRVAGRTLKRAITREELWNGNREPLTNFYRWDPEVNVIRWAWTQHPVYRERFGRMASDGSWSHADVHRLATPAEIDNFLERVT